MKEEEAKRSISDFVNLELQGSPSDCCIKISQFQSLYNRLSEGLKNQGISGSEVTDMLWLNLKGTCPQCRWTINGDNLGDLWMIREMGFDRAVIWGRGRALRFSKGLCPNERCSSKEIVLSWRPYYELFKEEKDIEGVIKVLETGKYWFARKKAAEALGKTRDTRAVEPLTRALRDKEGLALKDKEADEKADVRWKAAVALGEIGDLRAEKPLEEVLGDRDEYKLVQKAAKEALEKIKSVKNSK